MCEYCDGSRALLLSEVGATNGVVFIEQSLLVLHMHNNAESTREIDILHCPICGKKLTQQEIEL